MQPTQFDVVLGGQSQQPKAYDVVLGGLSETDRAIKALDNPSSYESAKQYLLKQTTEHKLLDNRFKSAKQASHWLRSTLKLSKQLSIKDMSYIFEGHIYHVWFSTPSYERVEFIYVVDPLPEDDLFAETSYAKQFYLYHFHRFTYTRRERGQYQNSVFIRHDINFSDVRTICNEFSQAFDFTYWDGREGKLGRIDSLDCVTRIGNFWDTKNSKMILLP